MTGSNISATAASLSSQLKTMPSRCKYSSSNVCAITAFVPVYIASTNALAAPRIIILLGRTKTRRVGHTHHRMCPDKRMDGLLSSALPPSLTLEHTEAQLLPFFPKLLLCGRPSW